MFKTVILFFLVSFSLLSKAITLEHATLYDRGITPRTEEQRQASYIAYDVLNAAGENVYALNALTNMGNSEIWYVFSNELRIFSVDVESQNITDNSHIAPWSNHLFLYGEYPAAQERLSGARGVEAPPQQPILSAVRDRAPTYEGAGDIGCYHLSPLRYGDTDNDSQPELVLFLNNNVVFFSPQSGRITFSYHFWLDDEVEADSLIYEADSTYMERIRPGDPIYFALSGFNVLVDDIYPARRSLTKLYINDFVEEGRHDIILWRKLYESNARSVAEGGYRLLGNYYAHYVKQSDGTYATVNTEQSQLQSLLSSENLTWASGYPSQSECAGQGGQLIPEMHDPLLNDPEVLPATPP